jgi:hypothetical protein
MKNSLVISLLFGAYNHIRAIIFFTTLCVLIIPAKTRAQTFTHGKSEFVTYHTADTFSIQVPDYLVKVSDLDSRATLQFKNIFNETYFIIVPEQKSALGHMDLEQLEEHFEVNLLFNGGIIIDHKETKVGKYNAFQNEVEWLVDGQALSYLITFINTPNTLYKIYSWTLASQKEYLTDFKKATSSFLLTQRMEGKR